VDKIFSEIKYDLNFIRGHTLQPRWYKILKVFLVLGFLGAYSWLFGGAKTLLFCGVFFSLSLVIHFLYRIKTGKFSHSWLDFKVELVDGVSRPTRIGPYYYLAVIANGLIAFLISQWLGK
jgi:hypothetical protein